MFAMSWLRPWLIGKSAPSTRRIAQFDRIGPFLQMLKMARESGYASPSKSSCFRKKIERW
jgi:hypothetical protein